MRTLAASCSLAIPWEAASEADIEPVGARLAAGGTAEVQLRRWWCLCRLFRLITSLLEGLDLLSTFLSVALVLLQTLLECQDVAGRKGLGCSLQGFVSLYEAAHEQQNDSAATNLGVRWNHAAQ